MTPEIAIWVIGTAAVPTLGWIFWMSGIMTKMSGDTKKLVRMHESPDDYGFGTVATNEAVKGLATDESVKDLTIAVRDLTHYIIISIKNQTGQTPDPPLPGL